MAVFKAFATAQEGRVEVVRVLAELGANVDTPNNNGATPAFIAAQNGHTKVIRLLASLKPDLVTNANNAGDTPLAISVDGGHHHAYPVTACDVAA